MKIRAREIHEVHVIKEMELSRDILLDHAPHLENEIDTIVASLQDAIDTRNQEKIFNILYEHEIDTFIEWETIEEDWFSDRKGGYPVDIIFE